LQGKQGDQSLPHIGSMMEAIDMGENIFRQGVNEETDDLVIHTS
jgi:hypothetical protein